MSFGKAEADAELAAIDYVVKRVRQSRIYRVAGDIAMMWGGLQFLQFAVMMLLPAHTRGWSWLFVDALGVALTVRVRSSPRLRCVDLIEQVELHRPILLELRSTM